MTSLGNAGWYCQNKQFNWEKDLDTLILLILSVNLELNSKESVEDIVFVFGSLLRILCFAHDKEWSSLTTSSSFKFN